MENTYISLTENAYDVIMTSFLSNFFENFNLSSSYKGLSPHQIWFNLNQGKQSYGGDGFRHPQVEDVLNRPGEIGLNSTKIAKKPRNREMKIFFRYLKRILFCIKLPFQ